jgi:hypothetical protein
MEHKDGYERVFAQISFGEDAFDVAIDPAPPPATHDMLKTLERNGLIRGAPGRARPIQLLVIP